MKAFVLLLPLLLVACDSAPEVAEKPEVKAAPIKQVFDVRSLLFRDIQAIKKELGKSEDMSKPTPLQVKMDIPGDVEFVRDTLSLVVSYSPKTHMPVSFNLSYPHPVKDVAVLLGAGGLEASGVQYKVRPMPVIIAPEWIASVTVTPIR